MKDAILLGLVFGVGAALAVGPIFVTIIHEAATRGFLSSFAVILGSAAADLVLLAPALALSWLIAGVGAASAWVGAAGALFFVYLGVGAGRDAWRLWRGGEQPRAASGWSFWKGVLGNLLNPLTWTFWLATGTPTMLRAYGQAGWPGLALFTAVWFVTASGLEALIALAVVRSRRLIGARGLALFNGLAAVMFLALAAGLIAGSGLI
ncbi:MAG: LysE family transporter [Kouleothrix sp.]|nr:LysE family transporter [Kouleothrix sp.]